MENNDEIRYIRAPYIFDIHHTRYGGTREKGDNGTKKERRQPANEDMERAMGGRAGVGRASGGWTCVSRIGGGARTKRTHTYYMI